MDGDGRHVILTSLGVSHLNGSSVRSLVPPFVSVTLVWFPEGAVGRIAVGKYLH